jgi:hypothetical protein
MTWDETGFQTRNSDWNRSVDSKHMKFTSCKAYADVWMRPATKADGTTYYEYIVLYVDDCLVISENPEAIIRQELGKYFTLKEASIGPPDIYLGGKMRQVVMDNGAKGLVIQFFPICARSCQ